MIFKKKDIHYTMMSLLNAQSILAFCRKHMSF